jgi:heme exporter protein D
MDILAVAESYPGYVWQAFGITLLVIIANIYFAYRQNRLSHHALRRHLERQDQQESRT